MQACFILMYTRVRDAAGVCACTRACVEQQVLVWQSGETRVEVLFPLQSASARSEPTLAFPKMELPDWPPNQ